LRPLWVVAGILTVMLVARSLIVPKDFGIGERGYMYGWHRAGNEAEWKAFEVKFKTAEYCKGCHSDNYASIKQSPHARINCENCHGPARNHPQNPPKLKIDRSRALCLRCHFALPYPNNARSQIPGIDPDKHNPGIECATCHNPHKPTEGLR
jgi:predicted CXXCH cytochrome family protein